MRRLSGSLLVLTCAVVVLGVGSIFRVWSSPARASGPTARFALVYDLDLREWPFPVDPTVARQVTEVSGTPDPESPCNSEEGPKKGPYYTGFFAGDYRAEVVYYGPFFVPTGKNVFNCDGASTYSFFLPRDVDGALFSVLSPAVFIGAYGLAVGTVLTTAYLTLGGGFLLVRGSERSHRLVGLAAVLAGLLTAATTFFAIATTAI
jgi:hypothetical protein